MGLVPVSRLWCQKASCVLLRRTVCIFSHNIQPHLQVTEDVLMREFGAYGPIASVKIMWPRTQVCCVCSGCVVRVSVLLIHNCAKIMCMRRSRSIMLQHTATHCNTLQHPATHCTTLQDTAPHCRTLHHMTTHCNILQHAATHQNTLQYAAPHCNTLHHAATRCNARQHTAERCATLHHTSPHGTKQRHTAPHCTTLQHTATHCNTLHVPRLCNPLCDITISYV